MRCERISRLLRQQRIVLGVELARDFYGEDLKEHVGRFAPLNARIVLNFVTASHYQDHPTVMNLEWKIVYERDNFTTVRVVRLNTGTKEERRLDVIQSVSNAAEQLAQSHRSIDEELALSRHD
jgi:hypothetical protein